MSFGLILSIAGTILCKSDKKYWYKLLRMPISLLAEEKEEESLAMHPAGW